MLLPLPSLFALQLLVASALATPVVNTRLKRLSISPDNLPVAIQGTYNTTFVIVPVTLRHAQSLLPTAYREAIFPPNEEDYPGLPSGFVPIVLELGHEANAGPPGLNFLSFQEAKIEIPNVARLNSTARFLYKRVIAVDNLLDVAGSWLEYQLNTTYNSFSPPDSSNASSFNYSIADVLDAALAPAPAQAWLYPISTYQLQAHMPWFGDGPTCAQHTYNWSGVVLQRLSGSVTLRPPYSEDGEPYVARVEGLHVVAPFEIRGPWSCSIWS